MTRPVVKIWYIKFV